MSKTTIQQIGLGVCLWGVCLMGSTSGQEVLLNPADCLYSVEGNCIPRRTTYGYYETHWRAWPHGQPPKIPKLKKKIIRAPKGSTSLPAAEIPKSKDEGSINPNLPSKPDEMANEGYAPQQTQYDIDLALQTSSTWPQTSST